MGALITAEGTTQSAQQSIVPENLSARDTAFVLMLAKDKVIQKVQEKYISDMSSKNQEIKQLNLKLQKKVSIEPDFASTKDAAAYIGVDPSYLTKRQGKAFKLGEHFFKPNEESIIRWKLSALKNWLTEEQNSIDEIDQKLENLLKRR